MRCCLLLKSMTRLQATGTLPAVAINKGDGLVQVWFMQRSKACLHQPAFSDCWQLRAVSHHPAVLRPIVRR